MKMDEIAFALLVGAAIVALAGGTFITVRTLTEAVINGIWKFREYRQEKTRWTRNMKKVEEQYNHNYCRYCEWGRPFQGFCHYYHKYRDVAIWDCLRSEENPEILSKTMQCSGRGGRPFTVKVVVHKEEE